MNFEIFNNECLGVALEGWAFPLVGVFTIVDSEWGLLSPIPEINPLSKQWRHIDSEMYFKFKDIKLIKKIKYVERKENTTASGFDEKFENTGKSASG